MNDIFISYARADRPRAKVLAEALEEQGYNVWWDFDITPGERFSKVIEQALDDAKCLVVLWSKDSVESEWVEAEATEGKRQNKLVPALIDDATIPLAFRQIHTADLTNWEKGKPHSGFTSILDAISGIVGRAPTMELGEEVRPEPEPTSLITEPPPTEPQSAEPKSPESPRRSPILVIGVPTALVLLLLVAALSWILHQKPTTPPTPAVKIDTPKNEKVASLTAEPIKQGFVYYGVRDSNRRTVSNRKFDIIQRKVGRVQVGDMPQKGDTIKAMADAAVRKGYIELKGLKWTNKDLLRYVQVGEEFVVKDVKEIGFGKVWVEIESK